ncbi:MAG: hypothetical protein ACXWC8_00595, partial [Limisphaerales bacterium]
MKSLSAHHWGFWKRLPNLAVLLGLFLAVPSSWSAPVVDTVTKLVPSDVTSNLFLGTSVAIDNGLAAVGAPDGTQGAVYTYALIGGNWVQTQKLTQPFVSCNPNGVGFGDSLAMQNGLLVVGQPVDCAGGLSPNVFVYKLVSGTWILQQTIQPDLTLPFSAFGTSVALSGNTLAVGDPDDQTGPGSGTVSIFTNNGTLFLLQTKVAAPSNTFQAFTGVSVALEGDTLLAGAPGFTVGGAAFVFSRNGTTWTLSQTLHPTSHTGAVFGVSAALQGGTLVVGAPRDADTNGIFGGGVFVYQRTGNTFVEQQELTPTANVFGLGFGTSVSVLNGTIVAGVPFRTVNGQTGAGAADIFTFNGTSWGLAQEITASDPFNSAQFGYAVDIGESGIIVGAPFDSPVFTNAGAAYIFSSSQSNGPVIVSATASPNQLFPPNHKLVPVTITVNATGSFVSCVILGVRSNQPINGKGDGNTSP